MFWKRSLWSLLGLYGVLIAHAQTPSVAFKLADGAVLNGQPVAVKESFVQVKLDDGSFTNLFWARLSQETFRDLEKIKTTAPYANIFLDPPARPRETAVKKDVVIKPVTRLERPKAGSLLASPVMLALLLVAWAAGIYAGYEVSVFRQQPPALVCTLSALLPLLGPVIFLAMPTRKHQEEPAWEAAPEHAPVEEAPVVEEAPAPVAQAAQSAIPQQVVYARGQFTFNRRFFETKLSGFLKMVPGDAERDKVIYIKSARGEYTGHRFSKIEPNELTLQIKKGAVSEEVMIPFGEIYEVVIKHSDA